MQGLSCLKGVFDPEVQLVHAQLLGEEVHLGLVDEGGVDARDAPDWDGACAVGAGLHDLYGDVSDVIWAGEEVRIAADAVINFLTGFVTPVSTVYQDLGIYGYEFSIFRGAGGAVDFEAEPFGRAEKRLPLA